MATFGQRLRELRTEKKLLQEELADQFNISKSSIGMYERDQREPSFDLVKNFAEFFGVITDYMLGKSDHRTAEELARHLNKSSANGRAFYGGPEQYTEEELAIAEAAAKAAIEAYRKVKQKGQEEK